MKSNWKVQVSKEEIPELIGSLIDLFEDLFEDFLEEKGVTSEMMPNPERDTEDNCEETAIIYGEDYDLLADSIADVLGITRP